MQIIKSFDAQLLRWRADWAELRSRYGNLVQIEFIALLIGALNLGEYYRMMTDFYLNYAVLVINSFGLQDALERKGMNIPYFFSRVYMAAHRCAILVRDRLGPSGHLKYSPDSHFVQTSYAVLSLLKVGIPKAVINYAPSLFF